MDKLAALGAQKDPEEESIDLMSPRNMITTGAKLNQITQSTIYKHLRNKQNITRKATEWSLSLIQNAMKTIFDFTPMDEATWRSIWHKDIMKKIWEFMWKQMHKIYRLGSF